MTKKVKVKKSTKKVDKTPEITKAAKALETYLKENNLDPSKDWSKDKKHGKAVKDLLAKLNKERDKVAAKYPENDKENSKKLLKLKVKEKEAKKAKEEEKEKKTSTRTPSKYDYPLVDGREMTSAEKKKYRMEQRKLAAGKTKPSESKESKEKVEKGTSKKKDEEKKVKKVKVAKTKKDED